MSGLSQEASTQLFREKPHRFLEVDGGELAYRCVGTGPDVLFIHGWPLSSATYRKLLPHLVDHVTCHLIDLPSAGMSRFDEHTPHSMEQHVASVKASADLLELDNFSVVGHDSGGLIARQAFVGDPRLRSMCLIDTEHPNPTLKFRTLVASVRLPGAGRVLSWVAKHPRIYQNQLALGSAFCDRSLLRGEFEEFFLKPLRGDLKYRDASARLARTADLGNMRYLEDLHKQIDVPVKLIWGENDPFFPVSAARTMLNSFRNGDLTVIEGTALLPHEEKPAETAAAMLSTLTRIVA